VTYFPQTDENFLSELEALRNKRSTFLAAYPNMDRVWRRPELVTATQHVALEAVFKCCLSLIDRGQREYYRGEEFYRDQGGAVEYPDRSLFDECCSLLKVSGWEQIEPDLNGSREVRAMCHVLTQQQSGSI
jgi:hypothetical protein